MSKEAHNDGVSGILIRHAKPADTGQIFGLVLELAKFEKSEDQVVTTPEIYARDFQEGNYQAMVAEFQGKVIGAAVYFTAYSTWKGKMIFLEDFVVQAEFRSRGVGSQLFIAFQEHCRSLHARLIKWQVLDWNIDAIRFYERMPILRDDDWINMRLLL